MVFIPKRGFPTSNREKRELYATRHVVFIPKRGFPTVQSKGDILAEYDVRCHHAIRRVVFIPRGGFTTGNHVVHLSVPASVPCI